MKKIFIILFILIVGAAITYYVVVSKSSIELNEASPLEQIPTNDNYEQKSDSEKKIFEEETEKMKNEVIKLQDEMPQASPTVVASGDFKKRVHSVTGQALLIESEDEKILRFENFETDNGPNLHIYLSSDLGDDDYIDLGPIKATKGNVNYQIDASIDTTKYNKVLVWCVPFKVLFSYAELN